MSKPSAAAMRAAKAVWKDNVRGRDLPAESHYSALPRYAAIIDAEIGPLVEALESIAAWDDHGANRHLESAGSYALFDEPDAVRVAREALARVFVDGSFNLVVMERQVFGVEFSDLEECELPSDGEVVGSADICIEAAKRLLGE